MGSSPEFEVIKILRSDGQDTGPGYWPAASDADGAKLAKKTGKDVAEKAPRAKPQMVRLADDDPRFDEWRIKLGILLKQELAPKPQDGSPWIVSFPRNYWLYEKSKHLWVSGYPVKSKLFKSPQDFGVHLLWLLSRSEDRRDCACVHCNAPISGSGGDELIVLEPTPSSTPVSNSTATSKPSKTPAAKAARALQSATPTPNTTPASLATETPAPAPATGPAPHAPPPTQPASETQTPPLPLEQTLAPFNQNTSPLFFRTGELVWFQMAVNWRIGLIASSDHASRTYDILPISHGLFNQAQLQPKSEIALRPFLAFTVPSVGLPELDGQSFDEVDWDSHVANLAAEPGKREPLLLDASKLAALKISQSFSLFTHISTSEQGRKADYHGAFVGAERVEVGDSLRVRIGPEQNVAPEWRDGLFGLREICTATSMPGTVFFKGDLYAPVTGEGPDGAGSVVPPERLPAALREELSFRMQAAPNSRWRLVLLRASAVLREGDVRGRFYPSRQLLPVLAHPDIQKLQREIAAGVVRESARQLNQRMDAFKQGYIGLKRNRLDMVGAAVPHGSAGLFSFEPVVQEGGSGENLLFAP